MSKSFGNTSSPGIKHTSSNVSKDAKNLLKKMLESDAKKRNDAKQCLHASFFKKLKQQDDNKFTKEIKEELI